MVKKNNIYTSLIVAIIVGSMLNAINSYEVFLNGAFTSKSVFKIILTYITPFCVSLYSSTEAGKQKAF